MVFEATPIEIEDTQRLTAVKTDRPSERVTLRVVAGPLVGRAFELGVGSWVIGRAVAADVRLESLAVSRMHAKLIVEPSGVHLIEVAATNPTLVNGTPARSASLNEGDQVTIGDLTLGVSLADEGTCAQLTDRELEVARAAIAGLTNAEIGALLNISPRTASTHLSNIYGRLGIGSRVALKRVLVERGSVSRKQRDHLDLGRTT